MLNPLPQGTKICVRLQNEKETFEARGMVIYVSPGLGMGVAFAEDLPANQTDGSGPLVGSRGEDKRLQRIRLVFDLIRVLICAAARLAIPSGTSTCDASFPYVCP